MKTSKKKLRFAPLIRVSTEGQEKKGASIEVQKERIIQSVEILGGVIPRHCWKYTGQEHATPNQERQKFDQLLKDSSKELFDAVIVSELSRWSRDTQKHLKSFEILRDNDIKFFILTTEQKLDDNVQILNSTVQTAFNEFHANEQKDKSLLSKIAKAKKGIPPSHKPYGRTFDKKTNKWDIDKDKKNIIILASERYLEGESMRDIAKSLGMNHSNLWDILKNKSGKIWNVKFKTGKGKKERILEIPIDMKHRLLPQKTIDAIYAKAEANKTYSHGQTKNKYLLGRMVFCAECGCAMSGQTNKTGNKLSYYRHSRDSKRKCSHKSSAVSAYELEEAVLVRLFKMYRDKTAIDEAVQRATLNKDEIEKLVKQKNIFTKNLTSVNSEIKNLIKAISKGIITDKQAKDNMNDLEEREVDLKDKIATINTQLESIPSVRKKGKFTDFAFDDLIMAHERKPLRRVSYENRRKLMQYVFAGKDAEGKRLGVYVRKVGDKWEFTINGILREVYSSPYQTHTLNKGTVPMGQDELDDILDIERDYVGDDHDPLTYEESDGNVDFDDDDKTGSHVAVNKGKGTKLNMASVCSPYNCRCND